MSIFENNLEMVTYWYTYRKDGAFLYDTGESELKYNMQKVLLHTIIKVVTSVKQEHVNHFTFVDSI